MLRPAMDPFAGETALLLSHPGHEVRIHGWAERLRPYAMIVTDGSGRDAPARTGTSADALDALGAKRGTIFGRLPDRDLYDAVRRGDADRFVALAEEVAEALVAHDVRLLVGDAAEHRILTHDLVAAIGDAAVALARARGHPVAHHDFPLHAPPDTCPVALRGRTLRLELDDAGLARKRRFAERYREIAPEIAHDRAAHGDAAFRVELLRPVCRPFDRIRPARPPAWQRHGERLARAGIYPEAITYERHVAPLVGRLRGLASLR